MLVFCTAIERRGTNYLPSGEHVEPHGNGPVKLQMHACEIGPVQSKSSAALAKEAWSVTHGGSEVKSKGKWCLRDRAVVWVIERKSTRRGERRNGMGDGSSLR